MPEPFPGAGTSSVPPGNSLCTTLLVRLRAKDEGAWRRFDYVYGPVVLGWCCGAGLRPEDAADVTQEVFRSVAGAIETFRRDEPGASFRGWLWRITQNKVRDFFRRRRQQPAAAGGTTFQQQLQEIPLSDGGDEESLPPNPSDEETGGVLRRALEQVRCEFADKTWQAFWGVTIDGRSAADVAAALGLSAGAVYVAKSRVLRWLREEFGDLLQ